MEKYKNKTYSPRERAADLLERMSVTQKLGQLICKMFTGDP